LYHAKLIKTSGVATPLAEESLSDRVNQSREIRPAQGIVGQSAVPWVRMGVVDQSPDVAFAAQIKE
jgi:hypothetical protein